MIRLDAHESGCFLFQGHLLAAVAASVMFERDPDLWVRRLSRPSQFFDLLALLYLGILVAHDAFRLSFWVVSGLLWKVGRHLRAFAYVLVSVGLGRQRYRLLGVSIQHSNTLHL